MAATSQSSSVPAPTRLRIGPQIAFGTGQIAGQVFRDVPSLLLLFFMTNTLGVAPALAGLAIFAPKLGWGVLCDLGVGVVSDRLKHRVARHWWLIAGAVLAPAALILLFQVPEGPAAAKALYVAFAFSLYMMVFATFSVPYLATASELSADPHQRTVVMAWRLVFTAVGVLIAGSFAPIFIQSEGGGQPAYEKMARVLAVICPIVLIIAFFGARAARGNARVEARPPSAGFPVRAAVAALRAPRFSVLAGVNLIQLAGNGMGYASMVYFLTYNMARADAFKQVGVITLIASASIIAAQPVWVRIARRFGKKTTYVAASFFYAATVLAWGLLGPLDIRFAYVAAFLLGLSNSGWTLMSFSMMSDVAGDGRAGLYSSVWIAVDKIGFALGGALLTGLVLSAFGFDAGRAMAGLAQSPSALAGVFTTFAVLPALTSTLAGIIFARWGLTADPARERVNE